MDIELSPFRLLKFKISGTNFAKERLVLKTVGYVQDTSKNSISHGGPRIKRIFCNRVLPKDSDSYGI